MTAAVLPALDRLQTNSMDAEQVGAVDLTMDNRRNIRSMLTAAVRLLMGRNTKDATRSRAGLPAGGQLSDWTDAELYSVWCATGAELLKALRAEHTDHTLTAADARQYLLAELERRHPRETADWLASAAILSGEPPTFLLR